MARVRVRAAVKRQLVGKLKGLLDTRGDGGFEPLRAVNVVLVLQALIENKDAKRRSGTWCVSLMVAKTAAFRHRMKTSDAELNLCENRSRLRTAQHSLTPLGNATQCSYCRRQSAV